MKKTYYRPEIDGLRALAIIPVVFFHAGFYGFSGGYIGVDIFFVISGFLITSILIRSIKNNSFSFLSFFERRIRRILPALFTVISVTLLVGYKLLLLPSDLTELGKSVFANSFFLSNLFFMRKINYFNDTVESFPLVHTWTLSIEEQFYLIFPIFLWLVFLLFKKRLFLLITLIGILSFLLNIYLINIAPGSTFTVPLLPDIWSDASNKTAGFYLLPSRAWEFLIGSALAIYGISIKSKRKANVLSVLGLLLILYSITQFDLETKFPGIAALAPTLGCAAIIAANTHSLTFVGKLLAKPAFVWIGLISYSLYLWHWPIFVFAKVILGEISTPLASVLILISIILAWLTHIAIETPFRKVNPRYKSSSVIIFGIVLLALLAGTGFLFKHIDTSKHLPLYAKKIIDSNNDFGERFDECHTHKTWEDFEKEGPCLLGIKDENINPTFVLWGDSHSAVILDTIDSLATKNKVRGAVFSTNACAPISGVSSSPPKEECEKIKEFTIKYIKSNNIKSILIAAKWNTYINQDSPTNYHYLLIDTNSKEISPNESKRVFEENLDIMLAQMKSEGRKVFILTQVPLHKSYDMKQYFYSSVRQGNDLSFPTLSYKEHLKNNEFTDSIFNKATRNHDVIVIDSKSILCPLEQNCIFIFEDKILYRDSSHLNASGAKILEELFQDFVNSSP